MQVAVDVHWVGGGLLNSGTGMYRVPLRVVLPNEVPESPADIELGVGEGPAPASHPVVAAAETCASQK
jgi:hypothetical protein